MISLLPVLGPVYHLNYVQSKLKQHDRALTKVTQLKNKARQALRKAKREGSGCADVQSLAANFLSLLRQHSQFKRLSSQMLQHREASWAREACHRNLLEVCKGII